MLRNYEVIFAISSKLNENETKDFAEKLKKILEATKDVTITSSTMEARQFPYLIKKESKGTFMTYTFQAPPEAIQSIKEEIKHREEILKSTFIKKE
ncbi:MAG: 30S ribosomal protein S6 [Candidatus Latescibacteria bacterium]|nr:30S ribosomal protein S6 [Candidatus Latescibacterota bacterium]